MTLRKWVYYLFKDNERFWVCFKFYVGCSLLPLMTNNSSGFLRKILGDKLTIRYTFWCTIVVLETLEFKLRRCDSE
jgi:hypothetical protein